MKHFSETEAPDYERMLEAAEETRNLAESGEYEIGDDRKQNLDEFIGKLSILTRLDDPPLFKA